MSKLPDPKGLHFIPAPLISVGSPIDVNKLPDPNGYYGTHDMAQAIRDHRLQPRIRKSDAPAEDYECLCGDMFWGVAEWSYHVVAVIKELDND